MKRIIFLLAFIVALFVVPEAHESTLWTVTAGSSVSTIQGVINGASAGDTIQFNTATYTMGSGLTAKCGITYTATTPLVPNVGTPTNVVFNITAAEETMDVFFLGSGCATQTTFQYLSSLHGGLLFVNTPTNHLTFQNNYMGDLKCCNNQSFAAGLYILSNNGSNTNVASNVNVSNNVFGDSTSCTTPQNGMTDVNSPEDIQGICTAFFLQTSATGVVINNNRFFHVAEGIHLLCSGDNCAGSTAYIHSNISAQFNDFNQVHRIPWEEQPQATSGIVYKNNDAHDWFIPYYGSFGMSFACCGVGATSPPPQVMDNVVIFNSSPSGRYGYGGEDWGTAAVYDNNWTGSANVGTSYGMAWGQGPIAHMDNNTVCGGGFAAQSANSQANGFGSGGYITAEGYAGTNPISTSNNVTFTPCTATTSVSPTMSPASGAATFPLTVTLTDTGYLSGSVPLGNTSIWYTTDGSTPVAGTHGTCVATGSTISLSAAGSVKALGMWGTCTQPSSYPVGYGFVSSAVITNTYTGSSGPVFTGCHQTNTGSVNTLIVGQTVQQVGLCSYITPTPDQTCSPGADMFGNTITSWGSSGTAGVISVNSSTGLVTAIGVGVGANATALATGSVNCSMWTFSVTNPVLQSVAITLTGGNIMTVGNSAQACANMTYNAGAPTQICGTGTDSNGTVVSANAYTSTTPGTASMSSTGLLTANAVGNTTISVLVSSIPAPGVSVSVSSLTPNVNINGSVLGNGSFVIH